MQADTPWPEYTTNLCQGNGVILNVLKYLVREDAIEALVLERDSIRIRNPPDAIRLFSELERKVTTPGVEPSRSQSIYKRQLPTAKVEHRSARRQWPVSLRQERQKSIDVDLSPRRRPRRRRFSQAEQAGFRLTEPSRWINTVNLARQDRFLLCSEACLLSR